MVAVEDGPRMRWLSVLRAAYRSLVTVAVCSRSPLPTENLVVSGLWFHSHSGPKVVNVSLPVGAFTLRCAKGYGYAVPQAPLTVCNCGQPSAVHVIGARTGTRPPG